MRTRQRGRLDPRGRLTHVAAVALVVALGCVGVTACRSEQVTPAAQAQDQAPVRGPAGDPAPTARHSSADAALAARAVLGETDLGPDWAPPEDQPEGPGIESMPDEGECAALDTAFPDHAALSDGAERSLSPLFEHIDNGAQISARVDVLGSVADARRLMESFADPALAACVRQDLVDYLDQYDTHGFETIPWDLEALGDSHLSFAAHATAADENGSDSPAYLGLAIVRVDRAILFVAVDSFDPLTDPSITTAVRTSVDHLRAQVGSA